ncbi:hypothetical protein VTL71DRAFT_8412 [Oculimacula yallundae]|uniref:Uncharacterized protein n=1 Tax=Oculimacula yallundae TaxID=86028 RepID=A0ABR4CXK0_9HELO
MENIQNNANASGIGPFAGRSISQSDNTPVANLYCPVSTCPMNSLNKIQISSGNETSNVCIHIQSQSREFFVDSQASSILASNQITKVNKPSQSDVAPQHTEATFQTSGVNTILLSPPPSPPTMVDVHNCSGSIYTDTTTTPAVKAEVDPYRMDRFLDEIQPFWYTGQGGRNIHHTTAMRAHLDDLLARVA